MKSSIPVSSLKSSFLLPKTQQRERNKICTNTSILQEHSQFGLMTKWENHGCFPAKAAHQWEFSSGIPRRVGMKRSTEAVSSPDASLLLLAARHEPPKYMLPEFLIWCSLVRPFSMK